MTKKASLIEIVIDGPFVRVDAFVFYILAIILTNFMMGYNAPLDIVVSITQCILATWFVASLLYAFWRYVRDPKSRSPFKQLAYFIFALFIVVFTFGAYVLFVRI